MNKKLSNSKQVISAYELEFTNGNERGIRGVLVNNGELEVFFNISNALDISWVKFRGRNVSFLSKNGLNTNRINFVKNFEGGFLYTCGLDNVSSCVEGKPIHGSMHYQSANCVNIEELEDKVVVSGKVFDTELFGKNLCMERHFEVYSDRILVNDTVCNLGVKDEKYILLYHTNFGYPFLDEELIMDIKAKSSDPQTEIAKKRESEKFIITEPIDLNPEDVYYHYMKEGNIKLTNKKLNITCQMLYSVEDFPITLEWKSMASGDYALGIEPALSRFDDFKMREIKPNERKNYKIEIKFF